MGNIFGRRLPTSKYHNRKVRVDGETFDSAKEAKRWQELKLMQKAGEIFELYRQVPFIVIPKQTDAITGKLVERECKYIADFTYRKRTDGRIVVEDTKGVKTPEYIIKRKLMFYRFGIKIREL